MYGNKSQRARKAAKSGVEKVEKIKGRIGENAQKGREYVKSNCENGKCD